MILANAVVESTQREQDDDASADGLWSGYRAAKDRLDREHNPLPTHERALCAWREASRTAFRGRGLLGLFQRFFFPLPRKPRDYGRPLKYEADYAAIKLGPNDEQLAKSLVEEARNIYDARGARLERVHARATTLQGTVAIATSLLVATAALPLDPNKIADERIRRWLSLVLGLLVLCLVMTGYMAAAAALRTSERARTSTRGIVGRFKLSGTNHVEHLRLQAIDLLVAAEKNKELDLRRSATLQSARGWYRIALGLVSCSRRCSSWPRTARRRAAAAPRRSHGGRRPSTSRARRPVPPAALAGRGTGRPPRPAARSSPGTDWCPVGLG